MAATQMDSLFFSLFVTVNICSVFLYRQEEFSKVLVQTLPENQISSTLFSDVCGQRVVVKFGRLEKVSLVKHGFRRSRMSVLKWMKHVQLLYL